MSAEPAIASSAWPSSLAVVFTKAVAMTVVGTPWSSREEAMAAFLEEYMSCIWPVRRTEHKNAVPSARRESISRNIQ